MWMPRPHSLHVSDYKKDASYITMKIRNSAGTLKHYAITWVIQLCCELGGRIFVNWEYVFFCI